MSLVIKQNIKARKWVVFRVSGRGFGSWKIVRTFPSLSEAESYAKEYGG